MQTSERENVHAHSARPTTLIAAGGTGGHIFPGIAVAQEIKRREPGRRIVFVGTRRGLESRLVPRAGHELALLPVRPLIGVGLTRTLLGLLSLPYALMRALALMLRLRPDAVLGVGGYAGGPVVLMAALLGIRTVVLEPNASPGFTNRVLGPVVKHAACSYEEARRAFGRKGVLTGNPVRSQLTTVPARPHVAPFTLLTFGGSQGSRVLNQALLAALPSLPGADRLRIVHQTGPTMHAEMVAAYRAAGRADEVLAFIDDMDQRYAQADLVVSRSGATTCAELAATGRAAILVPFARAAGDHQLVNARAFARAGAAVVIEERELSGETLTAAVRALIEQPSRIASMEQAARALARPDAAARVADLLLGRAESQRQEGRRDV
jgi:UDP-N-acetylglucosamine--N-acetylmuramyl-(pentapeptide) pyrophosphoryl-undecaprenol N-acetylglucosamine transferase